MKAAGYKIIPEGNRYRLTRGTRHTYLTRIDGEWRQTTKDGVPAQKRIPPADLARIVERIES